MKAVTALLSCLSFILSLAAQNSDTSCFFKITKFKADKSIEDIKFSAFSCNETLDLDYYKKNFYEPYHFPPYFVDLKYRNETVVKWKDSTAEKKYFENW